MPHIIIKAIEGATREQMQKAAEDALAAVSRALGKPAKYCSAAAEEYSFGEWEKVYNECIKDNGSVLIKPGYTNPKTFQ
jgi:phenylpyruvate tautomerase PptA (4-oxalocrotonate tautomerase family)